MGRPKQSGLQYFPFDTDFFFADRRIRALRARFVGDGIMFYIYLLTEIYRNGYYIRWDEDAIDGALDLNLTEGLIKQIVKFLISRSLITEITLANSDTFLSAPGIQKRYQEAMKSFRRDIFVDSEIWLLGEDETASFIKCTKKESFYGENSNKYGENSNKSRKNDTKEKKRKENILLDTNVSNRPSDKGRIITAWNELTQFGIAPIKSISEGSQRMTWLRARIKQYGTDAILEAIDNIKYSNFLQGKNRRGWIITFDWFIRPSNFQKVLEGNYTDKKPLSMENPTVKNNNAPEPELSDDEWLAMMQKGEGK